MNLLDRHDVLLLNELQRDARQTVQQLAAAAGLSSTPCWRRIKELEAAGVIRGYTVLVDRARVNLQLCVLAEINLGRHEEGEVQRFEQAVAQSPQIVACWSTTGQADYVIKVLVPDIEAYERFLHETAFRLPGVTHVRSSVVMKEVKSETRLPIVVPARGAAPGKARKA
jgi:DNA-binding Lrp family transcriptional regulator